MPHPWQYTRWRRVAMQVAVWVVFAGVMGLAALVDRYRTPVIRLARPARLGEAVLLLPVDWDVTTPPTLRGSAIEVRERTNGSESNAPGRVLSIALVHAGSVPPEDLLSELEQHRLGQVGPITGFQFGKYPGAEAIVRITAIDEQTGDQLRGYEINACTVLPKGQGILLRLTGPLDPTPRDERLVQQVADSLRIAPEGAIVQKPASPGENPAPASPEKSDKPDKPQKIPTAEDSD